MTYADFLRAKAVQHAPTGIENHGPLNEQLFAFQADITHWALQRGRAAIFSGCGTGKSAMALEWARNVVAHTGKPVLIVTPLAVAQQFVREGEKFRIDVRHIREPVDVIGGARIYVVNYERLHLFTDIIAGLGGVVLDESSILKNFAGATRNALIETFRDVSYRLCCSATPAPNDSLELANHVEFLGIMRRSEMMATWFINDGETTQQWRLKKHAAKDFWRFCSTWAVCLSKPSDRGYSDDGYDLPPLRIHDHVVDLDQKMANDAGLLFAFEAATLSEQRMVRRASLNERVSAAAGIVKASDEQFLCWAELNDESSALASAVPGAVEITGSQTAEFKESAILAFADGETRVIVTKAAIAGMGVNLQRCHNQVFVGIGHSFESRYQAIRRCHRFGQRSPVNIHQVYTSADMAIARNLARKQTEHDAMVRNMIEAMRGT
jgi:hypothetical protein